MPIKQVKKLGAELGDEVFGTIDQSVSSTLKSVDSYLEPARRNILQRYPILFSLAATVGVTATFLGLEQLIMSIPFFHQQPVIILLFGVGILVVTGTIYKKN